MDNASMAKRKGYAILILIMLISIVLIGIGALTYFRKIEARKEAEKRVEESRAQRYAWSMCVKNSDEYVKAKTTGSECTVIYDENELKIRVAAYNITMDSAITAEELKQHFMDLDTEFEAFYNWYLDETRKTQFTNYRYAVEHALVLKKISIIEATDAEIEDAMASVSKAIEETDAHELKKSDYDNIIKWLDEN